VHVLEQTGLFGEATVTFKVRNRHTYLVAQPNGDVKADAFKVGPWEKWIVKSTGDPGKFTIKSKAFNKYLVAEPSGKVLANRANPNTWETFQIASQLKEKNQCHMPQFFHTGLCLVNNG